MSEETARAITRTDAANQAVLSIDPDKDPIEIGRLAAYVEDTVVSSGGKVDPAASSRSVNKALKAAEGFGVVKLHKTVCVERISG